jgi:hypothetical protein
MDDGGGSRVIGLVEFSPVGRSFIFSVSLIKAVQIFVQIFPGIIDKIDFDKNRLGYILGDFFHKQIRSPWSEE